MTGLAAVAEGVNALWMLVVTFLIFFMHAGFAMLEAGQVRSKNVANQLTKNLLTWSVGVIVYFLLGAGLSGVVGSLTGGGGLALAESFAYLTGSSASWVGWLFGAVFAMTAATIVSGAVAGRCKLRTYVAYTVLLAGVIYPVVVGVTAWGGGFLAAVFGRGFHDFAGGMIVHGMGGIAGLTAAWVIGPRLARFDADGSANVVPGHSIPFAVLGTLILAFGWYGFNVGTAVTVLTVEGGEVALADFAYVGRVALVTTLGMAAGAIGSASVSLVQTGKVDTLYVANGMLAGLVGIADAIVWPGGLLVGFIAGAQLPVVFRAVERHLQIDDVCAVFPVHGSAGIIGVLAFPFVATGGFNTAQLLAQVTGVVVIGGWTVAATYAVFKTAAFLGHARVNAEHERGGLDAAEHGVDTYPEFGDEPDATASPSVSADD